MTGMDKTSLQKNEMTENHLKFSNTKIIIY